MPVTLRLTKEEQRNTELKCREINKVLINIEKSPMQESELLHLVIELALSRIKINKKGEIDLE
ncbi:mobilization protein BmgB [Shewanella baltica OS625]|nr:mobilization protein BmgB [Shewanella baltica OS625]